MEGNSLAKLEDALHSPNSSIKTLMSVANRELLFSLCFVFCALKMKGKNVNCESTKGTFCIDLK